MIAHQDMRNRLASAFGDARRDSDLARRVAAGMNVSVRTVYMWLEGKEPPPAAAKLIEVATELRRDHPALYGRMFALEPDARAA